MTDRDDQAFQAAAEQVIAESLAEEARTLLTLREAADVWLKRFNELAEDAKRAHQEAA
jgi:hypothetical protein